MIFNKNDYDSKQRFGIRKLSVGVCSVLLSTLFLTMNNNQTVHASTETESSESVEASASSGSNVEDQSASNSATTTVTSESTQTEASGTPSAQSESSKNGAAQLKTSGAETPKKSDEIKKDNVDKTIVATQNSNQQGTTTKSAETPSIVQKTETSKPAPSLFNTNIVVHLVHKTQDVTDTDPYAQETRTVTVNYVKTKVNEDGTYTEDGNAFTSAVLDVYYTRQATKDLVTGTVTYGPWQWNTKKGDSNTPGFHVVSGTWTNLPQEWATVTADVPTLDGYTAYTGGPATSTNKVPANQFVFPTWNGSDGDTSDISKGSTAYTTAAPLYEAQPVHTIFYVPNKTEARTITAKFVYAGGDKNGQSVAPDAQIQVFFKQAGTINASTNKVVYGGWTWDKTVGDENNLGFHVISGKWNIAQDGQSTVTLPDAGNDYVVAKINSTGTYTTVNLANPNYNSNTVFTTNNAPQWYVRNELTTYYVPKSLTQKTINRVINLTPVNQPGTPSGTQTTTQPATITRPVKVNADDSGVVFDGFDRSGWTTGEWESYNNIPVPNSYTKVIKQIVTHPDGTTTETTLNIPNRGPIPAQTVTIDTLPTVINITYTATATAFLAGTNESTYTGQLRMSISYKLEMLNFHLIMVKLGRPKCQLI